MLRNINISEERLKNYGEVTGETSCGRKQKNF